MATWDFTRGPAGTRLMLAAGAARGLPPELLLRGTGLDVAALDDAQQTVEAGQELQVARTLRDAVGDAAALAVAIDAGRRTTIGSFGVWGFAVLTSPTWGEALTLALRYAELASAFVSLDIGVDGSDLRIGLHDDDVPADVRSFLATRDLAAILALVPAILGPDAAVLGGRIETRLVGADADLLRDLLPRGSTLRAGSPATTLRVAASLLSRPLPDADPEIRRTCEAECARTMDRRAHRTGVAVRVRGRLLQGPLATCTMAAVAGELHIDARTLRRQLAGEGTSFRAIRDEVCVTLATEMLQTMGLSVGEVAHRLGYRDPTSFTHAFRRIAGRPPSALRSRCRGA